MADRFGENRYENTSKLAPVHSHADFGDESEHSLNLQDRNAIEALPHDSALLVVRKGPNQGARFLLDADQTIAGRNTSCEIFLDDVTVSRKHASFVREGGHFVLRDLGSLNGTYVNRELADEARLSNGDEVQIGKFRFSFHVNG